MADVPVEIPDVPIVTKAAAIGIARMVAAVISGLFLAKHIHLDQYIDSPTLVGGLIGLSAMASSVYSKWKHKRAQAVRDVVALSLPPGSTVPELDQHIEKIKVLGNE